MRTQLHEVTGANRYCGPCAIATILGVTTDHAAQMIREQSGDRYVKRVHTRDLHAALTRAGCTVRRYDQPFPRPTVAQWLRTGPGVPAGKHLIMIAGHHFMTLLGRSALCSLTRREAVRIADMPKRAARVEGWLIVDALPARAPVPPPKPVHPAIDRRARTQAQALAERHDIQIERAEGGIMIVWPPQTWADRPDPYEGDHYAEGWPDVLARVQAYAAPLPAPAAAALNPIACYTIHNPTEEPEMPKTKPVAVEAAPTPRPPNDRGQGRKPYAPEDRRRARSIALTDDQWAKYKQLGTDWLIERLTRAKVPG